jgi:hypothetical protein
MATATAQTTKRTIPTAPKSKPRTAPKRKATPKVSKPKSASTRVRKPKATATTITYAQFERMSVMNQIRRAFLPGARIAAVIGIVAGGFAPVASFALIHFEVAARPYLWVLVVGALMFSALTVFKWMKAAFGCPYKAVGITLLLEGVLTASHLQVLTFAALGILIFVNAVSSACSLQVRKEEPVA